MVIGRRGLPVSTLPSLMALPSEYPPLPPDPCPHSAKATGQFASGRTGARAPNSSLQCMLANRVSPFVASATVQSIHSGEAAVPPWQYDGSGTVPSTAGVPPSRSSAAAVSVPGLLPPSAAGSGRRATQRQAELCRCAALSRRLWESLGPTLEKEGLMSALHTVRGEGG